MSTGSENFDERFHRRGGIRFTGEFNATLDCVSGRQALSYLYMPAPYTCLAIWRSGSVVRRMNEVTLHRARLVLGWVIAFGRVGLYHIGIIGV